MPSPAPDAALRPALDRLEGQIRAAALPPHCGRCPDGSAPDPHDPARPGDARCAPPFALPGNADEAFVRLAAEYWREQNERLACAEAAAKAGAQ